MPTAAVILTDSVFWLTDISCILYCCGRNMISWMF